MTLSANLGGPFVGQFRWIDDQIYLLIPGHGFMESNVLRSWTMACLTSNSKFGNMCMHLHIVDPRNAMRCVAANTSLIPPPPSLYGSDRFLVAGERLLSLAPTADLLLNKQRE